MAEKKEKSDIEAPAEKEMEKQGPDDEEDREDLDDYDQEVSDQGKSGKYLFGSKKWILLAGFILFLIFAGLGIKFLPVLSPKKNGLQPLTPLIVSKNDNLKEERISPFFIPPSAESSRGAIRIDLTVIWNGLASIRFQKKKIQIRNSLYQYISELADQDEDLNTMIVSLENGMSNILQDSLGVRDLVIKVKEIKYL